MSLRKRAAERLRKLTDPDPVPGAQAEHPGIDLRAGWALAGAWPAALGIVRLPRTEQVFLALAALLGACGITIYLLRQHGGAGPVARLGSALAASLALGLAGAALVGCSLVINSPPPRDQVLAAAAGNRTQVRVRLHLEEEPHTMNLAAGFGEDRERAPGLLAGARVEAVMVGGAWEGARARVNLTWAPGPADRQWNAGDTVAVLVRVGAAEPGERSAWWLRAKGPPEFLGAAPGSGPQQLVTGLRHTFMERCAVLPGVAGALLPGMVMGERSAQGPELTEAMKVAGLAHLTAVSGANCAMVCGAVVWFARLCRAGRTAAWLAGLGALGGFVMLVGPEASVLRASVMGAIASASLYAGRGRHALSALCLSMALLLGHDPWLAADYAFQLSGLATAGIILMGRPMSLRLRNHLPAWLADGIAISASAQIACLPVLLVLSGSFSLYSVPANLLVAPLIPWITVVGTAALLISTALPWLAVPLVWAAGLPAGAVGALGSWFAALPGASRPWPPGAPGLAATWALTALTLLALLLTPAAAGTLPDLIRRHAPVLAAGLLLGVLFPLSSLVPVRTGSWDVAACDIGQGDAVVLNGGDGHGILIDAGPDPGAIDACLSGLRIGRLDAVFITHLHADHVDGLPGALDGRGADALYFSTAKEGIGPKKHPEAVRLHAGARGHAGTVSWEVLAPAAGAAPGTENDASLVIRFSLAGTDPGREPLTLLETGDIEEGAMAALLGTGAIGHVDILKIAHHGSANGGVEVIDATTPALALISVGAGNSYGHPSARITGALADRGVPGYRTDTSGTVLVARDGASLRVTAWKRPAGPPGGGVSRRPSR